MPAPPSSLACDLAFPSLGSAYGLTPPATLDRHKASPLLPFHKPYQSVELCTDHLRHIKELGGSVGIQKFQGI